MGKASRFEIVRAINGLFKWFNSLLEPVWHVVCFVFEMMNKLHSYFQRNSIPTGFRGFMSSHLALTGQLFSFQDQC